MSTLIYHGSTLNVIKLAPLKTDKNVIEPLYGCIDREKAIEKGLKALLELTHSLQDFELIGNSLKIVLNNNSAILTRAMLEKQHVYLYTAKHDGNSPWIRITEDNNITDCFYTEKAVNPIDKAKILMNLWLRDKKITIKHSRF